MKPIMLISMMMLFSSLVLAEDVIANSSNTYEEASLPSFLPHVGKALPGRCYVYGATNRPRASVLMISFEENGFELVAFDADKTREDFFDKLSYEDVLTKFPLIKKMFLEVSETAEGAVVEEEKGEQVYRGEIRESPKYLILRVFVNGKILKYCNYVK